MLVLQTVITRQWDATVVILHNKCHVRLSNRIPPEMVWYVYFTRPLLYVMGRAPPDYILLADNHHFGPC